MSIIRCSLERMLKKRERKSFERSIYRWRDRASILNIDEKTFRRIGVGRISQILLEIIIQIIGNVNELINFYSLRCLSWASTCLSL